MLIKNNEKFIKSLPHTAFKSFSYNLQDYKTEDFTYTMRIISLLDGSLEKILIF